PCNDNGTSDLTDDFFPVDVVINFVNRPPTGLLQIEPGGDAITIHNVAVASLPLNGSHTFTNVHYKADGTLTVVEVEFTIPANQCVQTITGPTVQPCSSSPPVVTCPAPVTVSCAGNVPAPNPASVSETHDCPGNVTITHVGDVNSNVVCINRLTITRTYMVTDQCGHTSTCTQIITVNDQTPPTVTCPPNLQVSCASAVPAVDVNALGVTDNCAGGIGISRSFLGEVITNQTCPNRFILTRTYRGGDACGNTATCTQVITVFDNTGPSMTCPNGITVQCASDVPAPNVQLVTSTDNCNGVSTITFVNDVISNQTCANKFTVSRTYRATDACGNSSSCTQTIIVNDNTAPSLTCPSGVTVQCASQVPAPNVALVTATDNCSGVPTISFVNDVISNQTCTNKFTITRTYRATDICGNSATCSQTITVNDNTVPTLTCPGNVTVQCASQVPAVNTAGVVTADNCGPVPTVTFVSDVISNQVCTNRFIVTRTYRSTDACGNSATCTQIITVFDNTVPVITFADPLIVNVPNGGRFDVQCHGQDPNWDLPTLNESSVSVNDNCSGTVTVGFSQLLQDEGNCPVDGYITLYKLTWTATDACGNSSTKYVFMALVDHIAPVLVNIPANITVNCDEIPDVPTNVYATDECISVSDLQYLETQPAPGCQNGQVITRTWIATDLCGNKATKTQYITLVDITPPVLQMLQPELAGVTDETILKYTCNEGGIPEFYDDLNAESVYSPPSCGSDAIIKFDKSIIHSVNCKRAGYLEQQTFHWYAIDNCGNETSLTIIAQLVDHEAPAISGVPEITCIDDSALKFIEATDNCGEAFLRYWDIKIPNPCGSGFAIRRTYEANDHCGNVSRDTSILIPNDHAGPVLQFVNPKLQDLPPGEVLLIECAGQTGDYTPYGVQDVSVQDGCSSEVYVTFNEKVLESNGCTNGIVATLSLEWTATDICGNVSKLTLPAFVIDHTPPVLLNFKKEITISCTDSLPTISATDNCGEVNIDIALSIVHRDCDNEYDVLRVITATDPCGNTITGQQTIHVGDGSGPIISGVVPELCDDLSVPDVTAFDPCAGKNVPVNMTEKQLDSPCRDGKVIERTWTATDACGNVSTVRQIIITGDKTPPAIQIPTYSIILKYLDAPGKSFVKLSETGIIDQLNHLDDGSVYVEDECDLQVIPLFNPEVTYSENCEGDGYFEHRFYTWTATDICGNVSSVSFDVYIIDDIPPVLSGVPNDAIIICTPLPAAPYVSSVDPAQPVSIIYTQDIQLGDGTGEFNLTRTWTGTDACGNVTVSSQHITWIPETYIACDIIVPPLVECNSHGVVISSAITGGLGDVTYEWEVVGAGFIQTGQGTDEITIYVGWTELVINLKVRDAYGCSTECSTVLDCIDSAINPLVGSSQTPTPETIEDHNVAVSSDQETFNMLSALTLWPNPANGIINLSFDSKVNQQINIRLINFLGQELLIDKINAQKGYNMQNIDISKIPQGSYLMEVKTDSGMYTKVVVILRK
ncbi:MAG: T9SS type A sorting domain-containing protein, partial [Saprospiraceae bacterium]